MTISRGQMNRQLYMGGGIMNVVPRDRAFLGGIKKAAKKAVGAVKKIASSDLGKAAITGAVMFGIPGMGTAGGIGGGLFGRASLGGSAPGVFGLGGIGNLFGGSAVNKKLLGYADYQGGPTSMFEGAKKFLGTKGGKFAALAGVTGFLTSSLGMTEEQAEEEIARDPSKYLELYYRNLNPPTADTNSEEYEAEVRDFVATNTSEYAVGGRVGFATAGSTSSPEYQTGIGSLFEEDFTPDQAAIDEAYDVQEEEGMPIYNIGGEDIEGATDVRETSPQEEEILIERDLSQATNPKYDAKDFMIEKFQEKGIAPKILGKGFQGDEKIFIIETPRGGTMMITEEDYITNFGKTNRAEGGRIGFSSGTYSDFEEFMKKRGKAIEEFNRDQILEEFQEYMKSQDPTVEAAEGGRIGFSTGNPLPPDPTTPVNPWKPKPTGPVLPNKEMASYGFNDAMSDSYDMYLEMKEKGLIPKDMTFNDFLQEMSRKNKGSEKSIKMASAVGDESDDIATQLFGKPVKDLNPSELQELWDEIDRLENKFRAADGGIINRSRYALGDSASQNAMQAAGIEGLPIRQNQSGVSELDLRDNGGFIPPVGIKEKEDDIPAMLSNNEFVFTADAVRGAGGGDVNLGAQRMYDQMKRLEAGGKV